jgi:hypothetical protein
VFHRRSRHSCRAQEVPLACPQKGRTIPVLLMNKKEMSGRTCLKFKVKSNYSARSFSFPLSPAKDFSVEEVV